MSPRRPHPKTIHECINLLLVLGFTKKSGIGRSKHPEKYIHKERQNIVEGDKPFILITHEYYNELGLKLMKKIQNWGFTQAEVEDALRGIKPKEGKTKTEIDTELEEI